MHQYLGRNPDAYIKRFYEKAFDCCIPVNEDILVDVCLHGMIEDKHTYLEYVTFFFFQVDGDHDAYK